MAVEREETTGRRGLRRLGWVALWIVTVLEVLSMGEAGLGKFESLDGWMYWFARFGYPPAFAPVVGAVEFVCAGLLLIPRIASYAALVLGVVMIGALEAVLTTETDLGWPDPVVHLVFLAIVGTARWRRRWRPRMRAPGGAVPAAR